MIIISATPRQFIALPHSSCRFASHVSIYLARRTAQPTAAATATAASKSRAAATHATALVHTRWSMIQAGCRLQVQSKHVNWDGRLSDSALPVAVGLSVPLGTATDRTRLDTTIDATEPQDDAKQR